MNTLLPRLAAGALAFASFTAPTLAAELSTPSLDDRTAILDVIGSIGLSADQHEWRQLQVAFAPEVTTDYRSLFGGTVQTQPRADLVAAWRGMLPGFDATQHMVVTTEVRIRDVNHAVARSNVRATHRLGKSLWVVGGLYTHELIRSPEGWQVGFMQFSLAYEEGDRSLVEQAAKRVAARQGER